MDTTAPETIPDPCSSAFLFAESNARRDDYLGLDMPFAMVQVDVNCG
jgi:hypothetical protein